MKRDNGRSGEVDIWMGKQPQTPCPELLLLRCVCQSHNCNRARMPSIRSSRQRSHPLPRSPASSHLPPRPDAVQPAAGAHSARPTSPDGSCASADRYARSPARLSRIKSSPRPAHPARSSGRSPAFTPTVQRASFEARPSSSRSRLLTWLSQPSPSLSRPWARPHAAAHPRPATLPTRALRPQSRHARARSPVQPHPPNEDVLSLQDGHLSEEAIDEDSRALRPCRCSSPSVGTRSAVPASRELGLGRRPPGVRTSKFAPSCLRVLPLAQF